MTAEESSEWYGRHRDAQLAHFEAATYEEPAPKTDEEINAHIRKCRRDCGDEKHNIFFYTMDAAACLALQKKCLERTVYIEVIHNKTDGYLITGVDNESDSMCRADAETLELAWAKFSKVLFSK